jgi:hypothetical protein
MDEKFKSFLTISICSFSVHRKKHETITKNGGESSWMKKPGVFHITVISFCSFCVHLKKSFGPITNYGSYRSRMKNPKIPTVSFCSFSLFQTKRYIGAITKYESYSSWMKNPKTTVSFCSFSLLQTKNILEQLPKMKATVHG